MELPKGQVNSNINVTPLVDVMLVLLIIFMVVTPMLQKGAAVQLPVTDQPIKQEEGKDQILLAVQYGGDPNVPSAIDIAQGTNKENGRRGRVWVLAWPSTSSATPAPPSSSREIGA